MFSQEKPLRVLMVAGEASGDLLGASLIHALRKKCPNIVVEGVAGPKMIEAGCQAIDTIDKLAVMGFLEPLKHLPEILRLRKRLKNHGLSTKPDLFIGIDAPDFNLSLEKTFKKAGIHTVHYVSPSVWAWRRGRIRTIKRGVDLMLTLLPFEADFYREHQVPVCFVGHPLADQIPMVPDVKTARQKLHLPEQAKVLAILPGSRAMEIKNLAPTFIQTAQICLAQMPNLKIITAMVNEARALEFKKILAKEAPTLPIEIVMQDSQTAMQAADVILLASGTATLEAMLFKKPMVVAYRMSWFNYPIARALVHIKYFSLPNLIANKPLVPEYLQREASSPQLSRAVLKYFTSEKRRLSLIAEYESLHRILKRNASETAANAILDLCCPILKSLHENVPRDSHGDAAQPAQ